MSSANQGDGFIDFSRGSKQPKASNSPMLPSHVPRRGTRKNFDRDARVTFMGLKFDKLLFFGLLIMRVIFSGLKKNKPYFFGVNKKFTLFFGFLKT